MTAAGTFHRAWRAYPAGGLDQIIGGGSCLVLAPHPDDESLGCGGLIASCVAAGRPPLVAVLTDGAGSHAGSRAYPPERLRQVRAEEVRAALNELGLPPERMTLLGQPDAAAPHAGPGFDAVVQRLIDVLRHEGGCSAILAPWRHDPHCDHEAASLVARAVAAATGVRSIEYPVWGWTLADDTAVAGSPGTGWRLDIAAVRDRKQAAIQCHASQFGGLITDDPAGFHLPVALLSAFDEPYETYLLA